MFSFKEFSGLIAIALICVSAYPSFLGRERDPSAPESNLQSSQDLDWGFFQPWLQFWLDGPNIERASGPTLFDQPALLISVPRRTGNKTRRLHLTPPFPILCSLPSFLAPPFLLFSFLFPRCIYLFPS
ncbi:uncharacterized protein VTP21DRAFT_50 [Calcarisporiella thermophila]|uniref:uncharacterized protein n=1 Tax=Calcarisporiella thermophila TaxID=911321 RepID=UPI0037437778